MANTTSKKTRELRVMVDDDLASRAEARAREEDVPVSQIVRRALRRLLATPA